MLSDASVRSVLSVTSAVTDANAFFALEVLADGCELRGLLTLEILLQQMPNPNDPRRTGALGPQLIELGLSG